MTATSVKSKVDPRTFHKGEPHEDFAGQPKTLHIDFDVKEKNKKVRGSRSKRAFSEGLSEREALLEACDERLRESVATILDVVVSEAHAGNLQAAKFLLDRLLPDPRSRLINFDLRAIASVDDAACAWGDVFSALSQGKITLTEAQAVCGLLKNYIDANGMREFSSRLAELETFMKKHK